MRTAIVPLACALAATGVFAQPAPLTEKQARAVLAQNRVNGQVGGSFDFRVTGTDKSYNYKLRATWITPEVAQAAARILMLARGFSEAKARESIGAIDPAAAYVLVEIDPREGSGVIPSSWTSSFGPRGAADSQAQGEVIPQEGVWRDLLQAFPRDYAYDTFLLKFAGAKLAGAGEAELVVRIYDKTGRVRWPSAGR